jgi:hypothetical protein
VSRRSDAPFGRYRSWNFRAIRSGTRPIAKSRSSSSIIWILAPRYQASRYVLCRYSRQRRLLNRRFMGADRYSYRYGPISTTPGCFANQFLEVYLDMVRDRVSAPAITVQPLGSISDREFELPPKRGGQYVDPEIQSSRMARTSNIGAGVSRSADCWRGHYSVVGVVSRLHPSAPAQALLRA